MGTPMPRIDIPAKVTGGPAFIQDIRLPGMLHARAVRQPSVGAKLLAFDTGPIERMPGVVKVVREGSYLAVVAEKEWQAIKAMRALAAAAKWEETATLPDEATVLDTLRALPARDIPILTWKADAGAPVKRLKARYTRPYLMHGAIGPSCALAQLVDGKMTVWTHTQGVYPLRSALADLLRMPPEQVHCIHVQGSGCYGHNAADDVAGDAVLIARAVPGRPVRVQWMREEEHTNEPYGAAMIVEVEGAVDADGQIVDWDYGVWSNTHNRRPNVGGLMLQNAALPEPLPVPPPAPIPMPEGGGDRNSNPIYAFPNARVVSHFIPEMPVRISALRSLGAYLNVFAIESFMDELAEAADADPVAFRLRHLQDERAKAVVSLAAEKFGWSAGKRGEGRGFAFARYKNLGAYCAVALALRVEHETGQIRLGRVVAAVDSGQEVNPDGIRNQIEGAILQAASWTMYESGAFRPEADLEYGLEPVSDHAVSGGAGVDRRSYRSAPRAAVPGHRRGGAGANVRRHRKRGEGCGGGAVAGSAAVGTEGEGGDWGLMPRVVAGPGPIGARISRWWRRMVWRPLLSSPVMAGRVPAIRPPPVVRRWPGRARP